MCAQISHCCAPCPENAGFTGPVDARLTEFCTRMDVMAMRQRTPGGELGTLVAQTAVSWAVQVGLLIFVVALGSLASDPDQDCDNCSLGIFLGFTAIPVLLNCLGLMLGLPIRLSDRRWEWLRGHGEYPVGVGVLGVIVTIIGTVFGVAPLALAGFPIVALGFANAFPPFGWAWSEEAQIQRKIERGRALRDNPPPSSEA